MHGAQLKQRKLQAERDARSRKSEERKLSNWRTKTEQMAKRAKVRYMEAKQAAEVAERRFEERIKLQRQFSIQHGEEQGIG